MKIQNPPGQFDRIEQDAQGNDEYGFRDTYGQEEIVNLKTNRSNMSFWKPELVMTPKGCTHDFVVDDMSKREFVCIKCGWGLTVNINQIEENKDGMFITVKQGRFKVSSSYL